VEVTKAGLTAPATTKQTDALPASGQDDPLIALAALRIELERRLRSLADLRGVKIGDRPGSIAMLARELGSTGVITQPQSSALIDLAGTLNRAVHAQPVNPDAAYWAMKVGPTILASLDDKISTVASSNPRVDELRR